MVHPGLLVAGVVGTVVTGVVIYAIVKEVLESPMPVGWFERPGRQQGRQRQQQQQFDQDDTDYDRGQSSSVNEGGEYELRRRRRRSSEDELTEEKTSDVSTLVVGFIGGKSVSRCGEIRAIAFARSAMECLFAPAVMFDTTSCK
jgi:hypothetical protein